ncbi:MAG: hypothetical protein LBO02_00070 [Holosporaceae bacterium]|jgi:hypothetical protein|nr:hypothetical protein [Holosporaceae bacterium]
MEKRKMSLEELKELKRISFNRRRVLREFGSKSQEFYAAERKFHNFIDDLDYLDVEIDWEAFSYYSYLGV